MSKNRQEAEMFSGMNAEEDYSALDRELAQMAQDVPEMPADFHTRWTEQIRTGKAQAEQQMHGERRRQWRYLLSAAAVFVFLIGGTLLTRGLRNTSGKDAETKAQNAAETWAANEAEDMDAGAVVLYADYAAVPEEEAFMAAGAASAPDADMFMAMEEAADRAAVPEEETEETLPEQEEPEEQEKSIRAEVLASGQANEEEPEPRAAEEPEKPEQKSEETSFLEDLGIFTLWTLAAAAAGGMLALAAALIFRRRKKKKNS